MIEDVTQRRGRGGGIAVYGGVAAASISAMPCHQKLRTDAASCAASSNSTSARAGSAFLSTRPSAYRAIDAAVGLPVESARAGTPAQR